MIDAAHGLDAAIAAACAELDRGEPVALPTETVYGLAADARNPQACARIFEAKGRPLTDPLIVHVPSSGWIDRLARSNALARKLAEKFWPGPLTMVLPRTSSVPDIVTAGQDTVAIRRSAHPVFSAIVEGFGGPLAAPSANRFGRISPTTAAHVVAELDGRIPLVVDGGPCAHGLESTIIRVTDDAVEILREGPVTRGMLAAIVPVSEPAGGIVTPGSLKSHYAPGTPLDLVADLAMIERSNCGLLAWRPVGGAEGFAAVEVLSETGDLRDAATNLYAAMRRLDALGLDRIVALPMPEEGLGSAIMERLRKAATRE